MLLLKRLHLTPKTGLQDCPSCTQRCTQPTPPHRTKRTLCSDLSIISVHGRQAPKEHRREGLTCFRSGPSLRLSSSAAAFPSTVNFRLCPVARVRWSPPLFLSGQSP